MDELERISAAAFTDLYGEHRFTAGGALCFRYPGLPQVPMLNRVVGLGVERPATSEDVDAVLAAMAGTTCYLAVSPSADEGLDALLAGRGLEEGWGWMLFRRPPVPAAPVDTHLTVVDVDTTTAGAWADVVCRAYGMPPTAARTFREATELPSLHAFLALDGDVPVAGAAVWVGGDAAYFGFAGTDEAHRGKGGQNALFAARVERALELGCTTLVTETGERVEDRPSSSYRNILRNGFVEDHVVAHRLARLG